MTPLGVPSQQPRRWHGGKQQPSFRPAKPKAQPYGKDPFRLASGQPGAALANTGGLAGGGLGTGAYKRPPGNPMAITPVPRATNARNVWQGRRGLPQPGGELTLGGAIGPGITGPQPYMGKLSQVLPWSTSLLLGKIAAMAPMPGVPMISKGDGSDGVVVNDQNVPDEDEMAIKSSPTYPFPALGVDQSRVNPMSLVSGSPVKTAAKEKQVYKNSGARKIVQRLGNHAVDDPEALAGLDALAKKERLRGAKRKTKQLVSAKQAMVYMPWRREQWSNPNYRPGPVFTQSTVHPWLKPVIEAIFGKLPPAGKPMLGPAGYGPTTMPPRDSGWSYNPRRWPSGRSVMMGVMPTSPKLPKTAAYKWLESCVEGRFVNKEAQAVALNSGSLGNSRGLSGKVKSAAYKEAKPAPLGSVPNLPSLGLRGLTNAALTGATVGGAYDLGRAPKGESLKGLTRGALSGAGTGVGAIAGLLPGAVGGGLSGMALLSLLAKGGVNAKTLNKLIRHVVGGGTAAGGAIGAVAGGYAGNKGTNAALNSLMGPRAPKAVSGGKTAEAAYKRSSGQKRAFLGLSQEEPAIPQAPPVSGGGGGGDMAASAGGLLGAVAGGSGGVRMGRAAGGSKVLNALVHLLRSSGRTVSRNKPLRLRELRNMRSMLMGGGGLLGLGLGATAGALGGANLGRKVRDAGTALTAEMKSQVGKTAAYKGGVQGRQKRAKDGVQGLNAQKQTFTKRSEPILGAIIGATHGALTAPEGEKLKGVGRGALDGGATGLGVLAGALPTAWLPEAADGIKNLKLRALLQILGVGGSIAGGIGAGIWTHRRMKDLLNREIPFRNQKTSSLQKRAKSVQGRQSGGVRAGVQVKKGGVQAVNDCVQGGQPAPRTQHTAPNTQLPRTNPPNFGQKRANVLVPGLLGATIGGAYNLGQSPDGHGIGGLTRGAVTGGATGAGAGLGAEAGGALLGALHNSGKLGQRAPNPYLALALILGGAGAGGYAGNKLGNTVMDKLMGRKLDRKYDLGREDPGIPLAYKAGADSDSSEEESPKPKKRRGLSSNWFTIPATGAAGALGAYTGASLAKHPVDWSAELQGAKDEVGQWWQEAKDRVRGVHGK